MSILSTRRLLLNTKKDYVFNITVYFQQETDPAVFNGYACPRVNSWCSHPFTGTPATSSIQITSTKFQTDYYQWPEGGCGVDVYYWNDITEKPNELIVIASGYSEEPTDTVEDPINAPDQNKYQLKYNTPGTYNIDITIKDKVVNCGASVIENGSNNSWFKSSTPPIGLQTTKMIVGTDEGQLRIKGAHGVAPDRHILHFASDPDINWDSNNGLGLAFDTQYRGVNSVSNYNALTAQHSELLAQYGFSFEFKNGVNAVPQIISHSGASPTDSECGMFDLVFNKPYGKTSLSIYSLAMQGTGTTWVYKVFCPVPAKTSLFGWALSGNTGINGGSSISPVVEGDSRIHASIMKRNNLSASTLSNGWDAWSSSNTQTSINTTYNITMSASIDSGTATLTSCRGPWLGATTGTIPMSATFIWADNPSFTNPKTIFNMEIESVEGSAQIGPTANWNNRPDKYQTAANNYLASNPITLTPASPVYFKITPYGVSRTFRIYDNSPYDKGESIAFYGYITET